MEPEAANKYSGLSVKELKAILAARSVSFEDCIEKSDLIARAKATEDLDPNEIAVKKAAELIKQATSIVCFTGAGMSVESGIPDFRSRGGLWEKFDPSVYASYDVFKSDPGKFWEMMEECKAVIGPAKPNAGHLALAELEEMGKLNTIITQNIDGLHQEAGNKTVHELHGGCKTGSCIDCKRQYSIVELEELVRDTGKPPVCAECGQKRVKTDVILFGEALPEGIMETSVESIQKCDLLIVIGSSLQVAPANMLPKMAKMAGAKVLLLNMSETPIDTIADVAVRLPVGECLPKIMALVKSQSSL